MTGGDPRDDEVIPSYPQQPSEFDRADDLTAMADRILGSPGRMIAWSKTAYREARPENVVAFNGNVCLRSAGKIWYGDLDLTIDRRRLQELADACGETVYVLYERDARFRNERDPDYREPAGRFDPRR